MDHDHHIPAGTSCELCGMVATHVTTDVHGVTHYYCSHHATATDPKPQHDHHHAEHDRHAGHSVNMFRDRFWFSLVLSILIMALAPLFQELLHYSLSFSYQTVVVAILGSAVFVYGGTVFLKSARDELRAKQPGMMTLISLAIISAYLYSLAISFGLLQGMDFFWEVATLITIMLLGHWLEMSSVANAQNALGELAKLLPDTAERLTNTQPRTVAVSELVVGDLVLIRPGTKIPADGVVISGDSSVDEAMITGESRPITKTTDSTVIAGTVNGSGSLTVKITRVGADTALAGIMRLVAEAQQSTSHAQILADRAAFYLTIIAVITAIATLVGWLLADAGWSFAIERMVSVLVIACPHALGLAVPLVTSISTSLAARNGLLVRSRLALESARNITTVLFDKTGTLTKGEQGVGAIIPTADVSEKELTTVAAALEHPSEHSIGRAIVAGAKTATLPTVENWQSLPGQGVTGEIAHARYYLGGPQLLTAQKVAVPAALKKQLATYAAQGQTVLYVLKEKAVIGLITITDVIRPESKMAIDQLHMIGVKTAMITGDSPDVAQYVSTALGIDTVFSQVLPRDKVAKVTELQSAGQRVAMVGDGVNDAPALLQADLGIAIGAGTDVAIESAGIILVKNDPRDVVKIFRLSQATYRKMLQNLGWAAGYNIVAIPLAAGVFVSHGLTLAPAVAAILMSCSTVIVAANAQLLRRIRL